MSKDDQELNDIMNRTESPTKKIPNGLRKDGAQAPIPHRGYDDYDYDEDEVDEKFSKGYCQWSTNDNRIFKPTTKTCDKLIPGVYEIDMSPNIGLFLEKIPVRTEGLIRFPDSNSDQVIEEIQKFWDREKTFKHYDLIYKRGILLWGPPGSGKSCTVQLVMSDVVERGGIVIRFDDPDLFLGGMRAVRTIQPDTPVVVIMEDIDSIIEEYSESEVLNILDGVNEVHKVVFLACPTPDMLILKSDLTWIAAGELEPGDELIGFDESGPDRRLRPSLVNSCPVVTRPCVRVRTENKEVTVSEEHPFLIKLGNRPPKWRAAKDLKSDNCILSIGKPWQIDNWDGCQIQSKYEKVISVDIVGEQEVVALDTSTKTFIGEGLLQHNTTNYPAALGKRIVNRPSRFDKRFKIGMPNKEARKMYFEHLFEKVAEEDRSKLDLNADQWAEDMQGLSIAHLKELFVAVAILGDEYKKAVKTLQEMKENIDEKEYGGMGFGFNGDGGLNED